MLGHTLVEGGETKLSIGKNSSISRVDISAAMLRSTGSPPPLVLLMACATAALGDPFGTLPGAHTAHGAGAVVGTLSKVVGPQGAAATTHLLDSFHGLSGSGASVGDALAQARVWELLRWHVAQLLQPGPWVLFPTGGVDRGFRPATSI